MFHDMRPSHHHRFLSEVTGISIDIHWPPKRLPFREKVHRAFFGSPPDGPALIDPDEFRQAVSLVYDRPREAAGKFSALGYRVTIFSTEENHAL